MRRRVGERANAAEGREPDGAAPQTSAQVSRASPSASRGWSARAKNAVSFGRETRRASSEAVSAPSPSASADSNASYRASAPGGPAKRTLRIALSQPALGTASEFNSATLSTSGSASAAAMPAFAASE